MTLASSPLPTVRSYKDWGPYFSAEKGNYQCSCLRDVVFHARLAMEEGADYIGLFDADGSCKGIWQNDAEPEPDGEGGLLMPRASYVLRRPQYSQFDILLKRMLRN